MQEANFTLQHLQEQELKKQDDEKKNEDQEVMDPQAVIDELSQINEADRTPVQQLELEVAMADLELAKKWIVASADYEISKLTFSSISAETLEHMDVASASEVFEKMTDTDLQAVLDYLEKGYQSKYMWLLERKYWYDRDGLFFGSKEAGQIRMFLEGAKERRDAIRNTESDVAFTYLIDSNDDSVLDSSHGTMNVSELQILEQLKDWSGEVNLLKVYSLFDNLQLDYTTFKEEFAQKPFSYKAKFISQLNMALAQTEGNLWALVNSENPYAKTWDQHREMLSNIPGDFDTKVHDAFSIYMNSEDAKERLEWLEWQDKANVVKVIREIIEAQLKHIYTTYSPDQIEKAIINVNAWEETGLWFSLDPKVVWAYFNDRWDAIYSLAWDAPESIQMFVDSFSAWISLEHGISWGLTKKVSLSDATDFLREKWANIADANELWTDFYIRGSLTWNDWFLTIGWADKTDNSWTWLDYTDTASETDNSDFRAELWLAWFYIGSTEKGLNTVDGINARANSIYKASLLALTDITAWKAYENSDIRANLQVTGATEEQIANSEKQYLALTWTYENAKNASPDGKADIKAIASQKADDYRSYFMEKSLWLNAVGLGLWIQWKDVFDFDLWVLNKIIPVRLQYIEKSTDVVTENSVLQHRVSLKEAEWASMPEKIANAGWKVIDYKNHKAYYFPSAEFSMPLDIWDKAYVEKVWNGFIVAWDWITELSTYLHYSDEGYKTVLVINKWSYVDWNYVTSTEWGTIPEREGKEFFKASHSPEGMTVENEVIKNTLWAVGELKKLVTWKFAFTEWNNNAISSNLREVHSLYMDAANSPDNIDRAWDIFNRTFAPEKWTREYNDLVKILDNRAMDLDDFDISQFGKGYSVDEKKHILAEVTSMMFSSQATENKNNDKEIVNQDWTLSLENIWTTTEKPWQSANAEMVAAVDAFPKVVELANKAKTQEDWQSLVYLTGVWVKEGSPHVSGLVQYVLASMPVRFFDSMKLWKNDISRKEAFDKAFEDNGVNLAAIDAAREAFYSKLWDKRNLPIQTVNDESLLVFPATNRWEKNMGLPAMNSVQIAWGEESLVTIDPQEEIFDLLPLSIKENIATFLSEKTGQGISADQVPGLMFDNELEGVTITSETIFWKWWTCLNDFVWVRNIEITIQGETFSVSNGSVNDTITRSYSDKVGSVWAVITPWTTTVVREKEQVVEWNVDDTDPNNTATDHGWWNIGFDIGGWTPDLTPTPDPDIVPDIETIKIPESVRIGAERNMVNAVSLEEATQPRVTLDPVVKAASEEPKKEEKKKKHSFFADDVDTSA